MEPVDPSNESRSNTDFDLQESHYVQAEDLTSKTGKENAYKRTKKDKLYKCRFCDFKTFVEDEFYKHKEIHFNGSQVHRCSECSFVTRIKHHLDYHNMSKHSGGEKPFSCEICDYKCINRSMLNSHLKSHQPPCQDCNSSKCKCNKSKPAKRRCPPVERREQPEPVEPGMRGNPQLMFYQVQQSILQAMARQYMSHLNPYLACQPICSSRFDSAFREPVFATIRESECQRESHDSPSCHEDESEVNNSQILIKSEHFDQKEEKSDSSHVDNSTHVANSSVNSLENSSDLIECYLCGILFRVHQMYYDHVDQLHEDDSRECNECETGALPIVSYNEHVRTVHGGRHN